MSAPDGRRWRGSFVSGAAAHKPDDPPLHFRREFHAGAGLTKATLVVTALGIVEPHLNGVRVGDEVLAPGWTSYRHHLALSAYDVTDRILVGANALGAIVGEGWAVGPLMMENRRHLWADRPALFAQLELEYADRTEIVATDDEFRIGTGATLRGGIYAGEVHDARLEPTGWDTAGFDAAGWERAQPFAWDLDTLRTPLAPPIRRIQELAPVEIRSRPESHTIVDFGQEISGWVRLTVTGERGATVTLRHAELLTPEGEIDVETNRSAAATDRYTLSGSGEETWEPSFTFHGFRYVEVEGWPGELTADSLRAVVVHSDMERSGWFETSNPLVTKLHENVVWSMRGNFVGLPTDCPQRDERLGWTGDINAFAPTATYLYDVHGVLASWLRDLASEQIASGGVPWVVPDVLGAPSAPTALWGDVAVNLPWELYQESGDLGILRSSYASMSTFTRQAEAVLDDSGLWNDGFQFGDWLDPDAPSDDPAAGKTDRHLVATAFLARTTRQMAATAELLGEHDDAASFARLADRVAGAFRAEYVTPSGRLANETTTAYALAIMFDLLDERQKVRAGERLSTLVAEADYTISTGFAGTPFVTDALSSTGHLDDAYRLLLQERAPSFLYPLSMGATTIWERWDAVLPDGTLNATGMTSLNHYALGAVADWLHRVVGGLSRLEPGWTRILVAPEPGGNLTSARTAHTTPLGRAEVSWRIEVGALTLDVVIPEGATATVVPPHHPDAATFEVGPGAHRWRYAVPDGIERTARFTLGSSLDALESDPVLRAALGQVFETHLPGFEVDATTSFASRPLRALLQRFPDPEGRFARALQEALDRATP